MKQCYLCEKWVDERTKDFYGDVEGQPICASCYDNILDSCLNKAKLTIGEIREYSKYIIFYPAKTLIKWWRKGQISEDILRKLIKKEDLPTELNENGKRNISQKI
ncbi:MAG TPA: hypothetical protein P5150_03980 [Candidatus Ratteibacteria bacterium]|nr:hypothetical protein [Candidatus Ratteibacteria bacterium]